MADRWIGGSVDRRIGGSADRRIGGSVDRRNGKRWNGGTAERRNGGTAEWWNILGHRMMEYPKTRNAFWYDTKVPKSGVAIK